MPRRRKRLMSEINVVPYIDVMLVLLIIFMITAPLMTQGVKVDLPSAAAEVVPPSDVAPVVVTVARDGQVFMDYGGDEREALSEETLIARIGGLMRVRPDATVLLRGDRNVGYGRVVKVMAALQQAGVRDIGMITEPGDEG
ncbi:MAG: protein TolR [Gammaproteobacteria bacterium]|nr:protein TolR [Gammaproteobacteria bacterium]NNM01294.1 protein TolR [Gammaproteobacteria bacterium]